MRNSLTRGLALLLTLLVLLTSPALAASVLGQPANGCVADVAGVLEPDTVAHMVSQNDTLTQATGAVIAVVTVDYLNGADIGDYARGLFDAWELGDPKKDNSVLLLLAVGEKDYYILRGKDIQSALPADTLRELCWSYLERDFEAGSYDDGAHKLFDALYERYEAHYPQELGVTAPTEPEGEEAVSPAPATPTPEITQSPAETPASTPAVPAPSGEEKTSGDVPGGLGPVAIVLLILAALILLVVALDGLRYAIYRRRGGGMSGVAYRPLIFGRTRSRRGRRSSRSSVGGYHGSSRRGGRRRRY